MSSRAMDATASADVHALASTQAAVKRFMSELVGVMQRLAYRESIYHAPKHRTRSEPRD